MFSFWKEKNFYYPLTIWLIVVLWYYTFAYKSFNIASLKLKNYISSTAFYMFSRTPAKMDEIVIVAIDEASRRHLNRKWPWPRSVTAGLIQNIAQGSPKAIGVDTIFSGASKKSEDEELSTVLKKNSQKVVLAYKLESKTSDLPLKQFISGKGSIGFVNKVRDIEEEYQEGSFGHRKFVNKVRDKIGAVTKSRAFYIDRYGNKYISMDVLLAAKYFGIPYDRIKLDSRRGVFLGNQRFIPSWRGEVYINYLAHYKEFTTIPAFLVLEKKVNPDTFKNKIVLIGATDPLIHDEFLTPLGIFPGVSIIADSVLTILEGKFIHNFSLWQILPFIVILGIVIIYISSRFSFMLASVITSFIFILIYFSSLYFRARGFQFDYFSAFFLCLLSYGIYNTYKYAYLIYTREKLKNLAILDPLIGFYTPRYFLLKIDEEIKGKWKPLTFIALVMSNYKRLSMEIDFEKLKLLKKTAGDYIKSHLQSAFEKIIFSQISQDTVGIILKEKKETEDLLRSFLEKINSAEFKLEDIKIKAKFIGIIMHLPERKSFQASQIIYTLESFLEKHNKENAEGFISIDLAELVEEKGKASKEDVSDFIASDMKERSKELEKMLKELLKSQKETEKAYFDVIYSLNKALEEKDTFTEGHSERVARYAKGIAGEVGLSEEEADLIYKAALLHDIGKIGIPDYILHKKEKLSEGEISLIRKHPVIGVEILKPIKAFESLLPLILHHHEFFDGTGYPYGLSGDMIPRGAQILSVADVFDAITSGRGYKKGQNAREAIEELKRHKGTQFNPVYVDALIRFLKLEPETNK